MNMFLGETINQFDDKNRIHIPAKLRTELGTSFYFVKEHDSVSVYPKEVIDQRMKSLQSRIDFFDAEQVKFLQAYMSAIEEGKLDGQGRALMSKSMIDYGGFGKEVRFVGMIDHIQILRTSEEKKDEHKELANAMSFFSELMKEKV